MAPVPSSSPDPQRALERGGPAPRELSFDVEVDTGHMSPTKAFRHQLDPGEPLADAVSRVCVSELSRAIAALDSANKPRGIHTARKAMKRTRAMLRLVRDEVGVAAYRTENVALRDASRLLSDARSAFVVARTAEHMTQRLPLTLPPVAGGRLVAGLGLDARHAAIQSSVLDDPEGVSAAMKAMQDSRARIGLWSVGDASPGYLSKPDLEIPDTFASIAHGVDRVYRRGRRAMAAAYAEPSTESFHEWRKRVRYLRYQIEALHPMWPAMLLGLAEELAALAEALGEEHDLAELAVLVEEHPALLPSREHRTLLAAETGRRRHLLQHAARGLGARVYAEPPDRFVHRLGRYWETWRQEPAG